MAKDDPNNGGFLSKMVKLVRQPTSGWSELDARSGERETELSKTALKELIERKKRNDFVRKREFDMLRKVRAQAQAAVENQEAPKGSLFPSSMPSKADGRAVTLKKIDEIEAQMSMQWWKTKIADSQLSVPTQPGGAQTVPGRVPAAAKAQYDLPDKLMRDHQFRPTEPSPLPVRSSGKTAAAAPPSPRSRREASDTINLERPTTLLRTQSPKPDKADKPDASKAARPAATPAAASAAPAKAKPPSPVFTASNLAEFDVQEVAQDPEVEEAAIRFANGDDPGAEKALLDVLSAAGSQGGRPEVWLALFDFYRATGKLAPFESRSLDFVNRFNRSGPQWVNMPEVVASLHGRPVSAVASTARPVWVCEAMLDTHAVGSLQNVLSRASQPWVLDWTPLQSIEPAAARALLDLFALWANQDVVLRFSGSNELLGYLQSVTPVGQRDVDHLWWALRLAVLRVMKRADEFELVSLDFCVTYELSPPPWERPRCQFQLVSSEGVVAFAKTTIDGMDSDTGVSSYNSDFATESLATSFNHVGLADLHGEIAGDPQDVLNTLDRRLKGTEEWVISCRNLIRVDFTAAGTLLNWVSGHRALGRTVQFVDVHRLVSAFFNVIGITEVAKVVLRSD